MKKGLNPKTAQRGIVLIITLLVLMAMILVSVGLMRTIDTSVLAVGNLSFRSSGNAYSVQSIEQLARKLTQISNDPDPATRASLYNDSAAFNCYYATINTATESPEGIPGLLSIRPPTSATGICFFQNTQTGNTTSVIVERLCNNVGPVTTFSCIGSLGSTDRLGAASNTTNILPGMGWSASSSTQATYRITARVDGPKNTVSFTQAFVIT
ncbi:MAG: hypothetical protein LBS40_07930 [Burkholderiales bacterium]|jgi:Tfp pilus assembly protein PilX|nr:hypothetical protein [Burkholderiales bacterium]